MKIQVQISWVGQSTKVGPEEANSCQLFTMQEAVQMFGQALGPQPMVPQDLRGRDERTWQLRTSSQETMWWFLTLTGRRSMLEVCTPSSWMSTAMTSFSWEQVHFNYCLEQHIKSNSQFRHMKHVFLCREDMLAGTFAKNQFSHSEGTFLMKSQALIWQSVWASPGHTIGMSWTVQHFVRIKTIVLYCDCYYLLSNYVFGEKMQMQRRSCNSQCQKNLTCDNHNATTA